MSCSEYHVGEERIWSHGGKILTGGNFQIFCNKSHVDRPGFEHGPLQFLSLI